MEKKNTVLLTVIAVATLLVAVVGATFAYFTATANTDNGTSGTVNTTTANVAGATLEIGSVTGNSYLKYPGGVGYSGVTLNAKKADSDTSTNNYNLNYQLKLSYKNATNTDLEFEVYKINNIADPVCKEHEDSTSVPGKTIYYYTVADAPDSATPNDCTVTTTGGVLVANGTLEKGTTASKDITLAKDGTAVSFDSKTNEDAVTYYLVVKYPNSGSDESTGNMGKEISAQITGTVAAPVQTVAN